MPVQIKNAYVYILTNKNNSVLYVGVTNDLVRRVWEHKNGAVSSFTKKYNVHQLVYYEYYDRMDTAIAREKQIKGGSRKKKMELIECMNPDWLDLYEEVV
jgi:putative endonuclease